MPDRSYSFRSAFSTNSSAALSLLSRGSFLFIMLHFPLVHAPGADRPDEFLPRRVRNVNTTKIPRPSAVLPIALKRSSDFECRGSGTTAIGLRNMSSISAGERHAFGTWTGCPHPSQIRLPASGSQPSTLATSVFLYSH